MATKDECAVHSHVKILSLSVRAIFLSSPHEWKFFYVRKCSLLARNGDEWRFTGDVSIDGRQKEIKNRFSCMSKRACKCLHWFA